MMVVNWLLDVIDCFEIIEIDRILYYENCGDLITSNDGVTIKGTVIKNKSLIIAQLEHKAIVLANNAQLYEGQVHNPQWRILIDRKEFDDILRENKALKKKVRSCSSHLTIFSQ